MIIHLEYFAILRECAGKNAEQVETSAQTAEELYHELQNRYRFPLKAAQLSVAINERMATFATPLAANDIVVFIAPISGG